MGVFDGGACPRTEIMAVSYFAERGYEPIAVGQSIMVVEQIGGDVKRAGDELVGLGRAKPRRPDAASESPAAATSLSGRAEAPESSAADTRL